MDTNDISACERLVMKVIWDSTEDLALQDIMNRVNQENGKSWKPQTVSTFLARLVKKSFLTVYRKGRYSFYQPAVSKEDFWKSNPVQENARFFDERRYGCVCLPSLRGCAHQGRGSGTQEKIR